MLRPRVRERLVSVILGVFKEVITHHVIESNDMLSVRVYWHLRGDPSRKTKQSKNIYIHLSEDCLDDYSSGSQSLQQQIEKPLTVFVHRKLARFDASNNTPKYARPPREDWSFEPRY